MNLAAEITLPACTMKKKKIYLVCGDLKLKTRVSAKKIIWIGSKNTPGSWKKK